MTDPGGQRWVLLEPPTAVSRFWSRALAVSLLVVSVVLLVWSPSGIEQRSGTTLAVQGLALLVTIVGSSWLWVAANLPRPITREVDRVLAGRGWVERRRIDKALRHGETLADPDRPAAAARAARAQFALVHAGTTLSLLGAWAVLVIDSAIGVSGWGLLAYAGAVCLLAVHRARRAVALRRAATRAGAAPLVAGTVPPSPRIPGSNPRRQRRGAIDHRE